MQIAMRSVPQMPYAQPREARLRLAGAPPAVAASGGRTWVAHAEPTSSVQLLEFAPRFRVAGEPVGIMVCYERTRLE